jgi:acyl carrier protein
MATPIPLHAELAGLSEGERRARTEAFIVEEFRSALLMQPGEAVDLDANFFDMGLTSLGLEALKQRFEAAFDCPIRTTELFNHPTIGQFVAAMERTLFASADESAMAAEQPQDRDAVEALIASLYPQA